MEALGPLRVMTHPEADRVTGEQNLEWTVAAAVTGGFFQQPGPLCDVVTGAISGARSARFPMAPAINWLRDS
jgi:hypothetical protein